MTTPDFFHVLTGWRKFDAKVRGAILASVGIGDYEWPVKDIGEAVCRGWHGADHDAPALDCSCGFYAYKTREDAVQHAQGRLLARVELWGRIAEHQRGYRSQRMKIAEMFVPKDYPAIDALVKRYGVPVTIDEGAEKWNSDDPSASSSQSPWISRMYYLSGPTMYPAPSITYITSVDWASWNPSSNPSGPMIAPPQKLGASRWQRQQKTSGPQRKGFRDRR